MRNKKLFVLLLGLGVMVGLTACQSYPLGKRMVTYKPIVRHSEPLPYEKWWFEFYTPEYFPISISFAQFQDEDNYIVQKFMPDGANQNFRSLVSWNKKLGTTSSGIRNYGEALPRSLTVCWDSVIDKKSYQTTFKFTPEVWQLMREPYNSRAVQGHIFYRNRIIAGLAPGGTARAWLRGYDKNNGDNILIATGESVFGENMTICQGKTKHSSGYGDDYPEYIKNFIKGKKYPYGEW